MRHFLSNFHTLIKNTIIGFFVWKLHQQKRSTIFKLHKHIVWKLPKNVTIFVRLLVKTISFFTVCFATLDGALKLSRQDFTIFHHFLIMIFILHYKIEGYCITKSIICQFLKDTTIIFLNKLWWIFIIVFQFFVRNDHSIILENIFDCYPYLYCVWSLISKI